MSDPFTEKGVDLLARRVVEIGDAIAVKAPGFLLEHLKNGALILNKGLPDYLESQYHKCETIRTLIKRDAPTNLRSVYEPHRFRTDGNYFSENEITSAIGLKLQRTIVSGMAGSGKSVFLKKLFWDSIESGVSYYPVFFELRSLPSGGSVGLLDAIFASIQKFSETFTRKQFNFGLRRGIFYLMIDALDEVPSEIRGSIETEILDISQKYPKCPLVLTSRPSKSFSAWEGFCVAHLQPFTKEQCISYIGKIDFFYERKQQFIKFLEDGAYDRHNEFLSNPLLASMLLLTFDEYGNIPAKRHIFYDKCFQVLVREHDASKGRYRREFESGLDYDVMEDVFTNFCVLTYLDRKFIFKRSEMMSYIGDAIQLSGSDGEIQLILRDFVQAICIIQKDGEHFEFTHRSFQEFFYAKFVVQDRDSPLVEKIDEILDVGINDTAVQMIADMDKAYFEREFLLPTVVKILSKLDGIDVASQPDRLIGKFFARIGIRIDLQAGDIYLPDRDNFEPEIYYSVTHDEKEYPSRKRNLVLYRYISDFRSNKIAEFNKPDISRVELVRIFKIDEDSPVKRKDLNININHQNRGRMIDLGSSQYAIVLLEKMKALRRHLEKVVLSRRSSLSDRIRAKNKK